jgi:hypothetical protein
MVAIPPPTHSVFSHGDNDSLSVVGPFGPDEEDPELYPDPSCEFPPFGDVSADDPDPDDDD